MSHQTQAARLSLTHQAIAEDETWQDPHVENGAGDIETAGASIKAVMGTPFRGIRKQNMCV